MTMPLTVSFRCLDAISPGRLPSATKCFPSDVSLAHVRHSLCHLGLSNHYNSAPAHIFAHGASCHGSGVRQDMPGFTTASLYKGTAVSDCAKCHTPLPVDGRYCSHCGTPSGELSHTCSPDSTDELRQRLVRTLEGRYEITGLLGRGGMAVVFLAQDLLLERQVAIKVLPPDMSHDAQLILRFQQEAKTAAKLDHPNIIPIYRVESEAGLVYFVMKYVSGPSLEDLLDHGPLPIPLVRQVIRDAALGLGHAHRRQIVHRDVKPANIMLDQDGRVILTDFGISKAAQGSARLTGTGTIIGTPHYMAPEQARGHEVDGRADQYALAIVGHRLLTGKLPFEGEAHSVLYQQVFEPPPPVLEARPDTPPDLKAALARALAKEPKHRFATMEEFATAVIGERRSTPTVVTTPVKPVAIRRGGLTRLAILGAIAAIAGAGWFSTGRLRATALPPMVEPAVPAAAPVDSKPAPVRSRPVRRLQTVQLEPLRPLSERKPDGRGPAKLRLVHYALLAVDSDPWGVLYVDDVEIGLTPVVNFRLPLGIHQIRIEQEGYRPTTETIEVRGTAAIVRKYELRSRGGR